MNRWRALLGPTNDLPGAGVPYAAVLRREPIAQTAARSMGGVLAVLAGYALVVPGLAWAFVAIAWLVSGASGEFETYRSEAMAFGHVSGMIATHLAIASLVVITMLVMARVHHVPPRLLCSVQPGFRWRFAVVSALVAVVVLNGGYWLSRAADPPGWTPEPGWVWWMVAILVTAPLQAAGEEFFFRGYLLQACGTVGRNSVVAVIISALVFAGLHGTQDLPLFVDRLAFGLIAGTLVVVTGGLEAGIAAHAVNNVFAFGYAVAEGRVAALRSIQGSDWATTLWNVGAYALVALACWGIGRGMRVATRTPDLP